MAYGQVLVKWRISLNKTISLSKISVKMWPTTLQMKLFWIAPKGTVGKIRASVDGVHWTLVIVHVQIHDPLSTSLVSHIIALAFHV